MLSYKCFYRSKKVLQLQNQLGFVESSQAQQLDIMNNLKFENEELKAEVKRLSNEKLSQELEKKVWNTRKY